VGAAAAFAGDIHPASARRISGARLMIKDAVVTLSGVLARAARNLQPITQFPSPAHLMPTLPASHLSMSR